MNRYTKYSYNQVMMNEENTPQEREETEQKGEDATAVNNIKYYNDNDGQ